MAKTRISYHEPPEYLKFWFKQEWSIAKKELKPSLDGIKKPKFYITKINSRGRLWGANMGDKTTIALRINGKWVNTQFAIYLTQAGMKREENAVRKTIRHEIMHCIHDNHSEKFKNRLNRLEYLRSKVCIDELLK